MDQVFRDTNPFGSAGEVDQDTEDRGGEEPDGAFIIFNEREESVALAEQGLRQREIRTYFWRNDIAVGEAWEGPEEDRLRRARAALLFIGPAGWGPNHRLLAERAMALKKWIIPIVLDGASESVLREPGSIFQQKRYKPLRNDYWDEDLDGIAKLIRSRRQLDLDEQVRVLKNGPDLARIRLIDAIQAQKFEHLREPMVDRLLHELEGSLSPRRDQVDGERPLDQLAVARSWTLIALLGLDAEALRVRAQAERHISAAYEPYRAVRFWTLGGLAQVNASYVLRAAELAVKDPELEIRVLADVLLSPEVGPSSLRERLHGDSYRDQVWAALRVLRVLPYPELLNDLLDLARVAIEQNGRPQETDAPPAAVFAYDVLYALAQPAYAKLTAEQIGDDESVRSLLILVVQVCSGSDEAAAWRFAVLLAAFDDDAVEAAFRAALASDPALGSTVATLREFTYSRRGQSVAEFRRRPGYSPEHTDSNQDDLGIQEDVRTLSAVMVAKDAPPPVAIGLFGPWGSGKSFFMSAMKQEVERLRQSQSTAYCHKVVSIEFNAWHYTDANLWASLVSHILERLAAHVSPKATSQETQAALVQELASAKEALESVKAEQQRASAQLDARTSDLARLKVDLQTKQRQLRSLTIGDLAAVLAADQHVKSAFEAALKDLGAPVAHQTVEDVQATLTRVNSLTGRLRAFCVGLVKDRLSAALLVVSLTAPVLAIELYGYLHSELTRIGALTVGVLATASTALGWMNRGLSWVGEKLSSLESAKRRIDSILAERRAAQDGGQAQLEAEIVQLTTRETQLSSSVQAAATRVGELQTELAELQESRSLARFLYDRTASDDYRRHLGLVSTARRDFEALTERLADPNPQTGPQVERIILYIDDLDRCAESRVKDVLEAVHLLLAFRLFVVVVGVDSRWLTHSLNKVYGAFDQEGGADEWRSTPQDYLEKIFQIIVNLRPMTAAGFGLLMSRLMAASTSSEPRGGANSPKLATSSAPTAKREEAFGWGQTETASGVRDARALGRDGASPAPDGNQAHGPPQPQGADVIRPSMDPALDVAEEALEIKPVETAFARRLHPFLSTPRAAKRFANTYRILKASVPVESLAEFQGVGGPGDFRLPMVLLAILVGRSTAAPAIFEVLAGAASVDGDPVEALAFAPSSTPLIDDVMHELRQLTSGDFPRDPALYQHWLPRVKRYGFPQGRHQPGSKTHAGTL